MRYIKLATVNVTVPVPGSRPQPHTTGDVIRHFLDREPRFTSAGPGVRHSVSIDTALAEAEAAGAFWVALEDAPFEALLAAVEKPEKGYPDIAVFNATTGVVVERFAIVRQLGPILNAIFDAPKTKPADFYERTAPEPPPALPAEAAPLPASIAAS